MGVAVRLICSPIRVLYGTADLRVGGVTVRIAIPLRPLGIDFANADDTRCCKLADADAVHVSHRDIPLVWSLTSKQHFWRVLPRFLGFCRVCV